MKKVGSSKSLGVVSRLSATLVLLAGLAACSSTPANPEASPSQEKTASGSNVNSASASSAPVSQEKSPAQRSVEKGIDLYQQGKYPASIKFLKSSPEIWSGSDEVKVQAHKYLAFSYCVTSQRLLCRKEFEKLLKIEPKFELEAAEAGHPVWGVEFKKAKKHASDQGTKSSGHKRN